MEGSEKPIVHQFGLFSVYDVMNGRSLEKVRLVNQPLKRLTFDRAYRSAPLPHACGLTYKRFLLNEDRV